MAGLEFHNLKVIKQLDNNNPTQGKSLWLCKCKCGNELEIGRRLLAGCRARSCGKCGYRVNAIRKLNKENIS